MLRFLNLERVSCNKTAREAAFYLLKASLQERVRLQSRASAYLRCQESKSEILVNLVDPANTDQTLYVWQSFFLFVKFRTRLFRQLKNSTLSQTILLVKLYFGEELLPLQSTFDKNFRREAATPLHSWFFKRPSVHLKWWSFPFRTKRQYSNENEDVDIHLRRFLTLEVDFWSRFNLS